VALDDGQAFVLVHGAQDRHVGVVLDHAAQPRFVTRAAEPVEDDAGDADVTIEGLIAEDERGDAAGHAAGVNDQHHRRPQQLRQGGVAVAAVQREAVVQPLVALDEGEIGAARAGDERPQDFAAPHEIKIKVVAVAPGGETQPHGVNIVGALLERLHREAAGAQGGGEPERDRGLAGRLVRGGDQ